MMRMMIVGKTSLNEWLLWKKNNKNFKSLSWIQNNYPYHTECTVFPVSLHHNLIINRKNVSVTDYWQDMYTDCVSPDTCNLVISFIQVISFSKPWLSCDFCSSVKTKGREMRRRRKRQLKESRLFSLSLSLPFSWMKRVCLHEIDTCRVHTLITGTTFQASHSVWWCWSFEATRMATIQTHFMYLRVKRRRSWWW